MTALKRLIAGAALTAAVAVPLLAPSQADAWWRGGWGGHVGWGAPGWGVHGGYGWRPGFGWGGGWGWRGGVYVGVPGVAVGVPYAPYGYGGYGYRWIPPHYAPNGAFIPGHYGY